MLIKILHDLQTVEGCTFLGLQLTDREISLGLGILQKYDQFKNVSRNQVTVNLLGYATERSNPFDLSLEDKYFIENVILGGVYKFARRCMSDEYPERLDYQSLDRFRVQRDFPIYYAPKYGCFAELKRVIWLFGSLVKSFDRRTEFYGLRNVRISATNLCWHILCAKTWSA